MTALRIVGWCVGAGVIAWTAQELAMPPQSTWVSLYPGLPGLGIASALALLTTAAIVHFRRLPPAAGLLAVTWLVPDLAGVTTLAPAVRTLADAWAWALPGLIVLTLLGSQGGRAPWRAAAGLAVAGSAIGVGARMVLVDPSREVGCWRACMPNPLVLQAAGGVGHAASWTAAALVLAGLVRTIRRDWSRTPMDQVCQVAGAVCAVGLLLVTVTGAATPDAPWAPDALGLIDLAALGVAASLLARQTSERVLARRLTQLAIDVAAAPRPGDLGPALGALLDDPELVVRYWDRDRAEFLDAVGTPCRDPRPGAEGRITSVARAGRLLAVIVHSQPIHADRVGHAMGPALRLVLENEQLRAVSLAQLRDLEASRQRILERAAEERRHLERNLHDGVQQRVVSLVLLLRMLGSDTPEEQTGLVDNAGLRAGQLLEELRRIARGIHPAVVSDAGLAGALADLADSSTTLPVTVRGEAVGLSRTAQTTAYEFVSAVLADAQAGAATTFGIRSAPDGDRVVLEVDHDAAVSSPADAVDAFVPYVEALSGRVRIDGDPGSWRIRLELPCAS